MSDTFISLAIVKPLMLLGLVFIFAAATALIKRYLPPRWRKLLLRKLW